MQIEPALGRSDALDIVESNGSYVDSDALVFSLHVFEYSVYLNLFVERCFSSFILEIDSRRSIKEHRYYRTKLLGLFCNEQRYTIR